jgi:UDP-N-acetylglucosamine--N-acetylmuramyl-(pentapeptide) pyrophosphoryl-undecaprenol N-acetylglucosamine transferase
MKTILLTGGGTAGHVTPHIALLPGLRKQGYSIHYAGTAKGIERELIGQESVPYHVISAGKLRRYVDVKNITDLFRIALGFFQALVLLGRIRPGIVFSKGGFVSCPVVWASRVYGIPVVIHESDITPGLANKLSIPFASKVCYSFPETAGSLPAGKSVHTGLPVRQSLFDGNAEEGRNLCGFTNDKPVVLVWGGSLGAVAINTAVRSSLDTLVEEFNICHICGKGNTDPVHREGYAQFEYVNRELPHLMAAAGIIISRAGATTLFELLALRKPSILIPLPLSASRGDQILNARSFERSGYTSVLPQEQLSSESFVERIREVFRKKDQLIVAMEQAPGRDAVEKVLDVLIRTGRSDR